MLGSVRLGVPDSRRTLAIYVAAGASFAALSARGLTVPLYAHELGADRFQVGALFSVATLAAALLSMIVELFKHKLCTLAELFGKLFRHDAVPGHFEKGLVGSRKNLRRLGADPFLESLERLLSSVIVGKVGDVLPKDHLPRTIQLRGLLFAEVDTKPVNNLR